MFCSHVLNIKLNSVHFVSAGVVFSEIIYISGDCYCCCNMNEDKLNIKNTHC